MAGERSGVIGIVERRTTNEVGDRVEVEWTLDEVPSLEWAEVFQMAAAERHGPLEWVHGGGPDVIGASVRWFVPASEVEAADREVRGRLAAANLRLGAEPAA